MTTACWRRVNQAQLTWMDAKVGDWVITPRIGKPVEVQALWLNALKIGSKEDKQWKAMLKVGQTSFRERFWNEELGYLYDVVDVDHEKGKVDSSLRPNQIFAVGGLPLILLDKKEAAKVVQAVEADLWTPVGLRTLSPHDTHYRGHYRGGVAEPRWGLSSGNCLALADGCLRGSLVACRRQKERDR